MPAHIEEGQSDAEENSSEGVIVQTQQPSSKNEKTSVDMKNTKDEHWRPVREAMRKVDKKNLGSLKDDVGNLLIFTGLFSAVVTAFVVFSLMELQPDPGDTSAQLLAQILSQTTSYTISGVLINSTHPGSPISSASDVSAAIVTANKLWFASLTLSLFVAFFSLSMQQWLRHMPVPPDVSLRQSIRLRQYRWEGWASWQAPGVLSILSIVLQIAVVLFVVGLIVLLRDTNHAVSAPVEALSIAWLALFVTMSLAPLLDPSCPYKSALASLLFVWELVVPVCACAFSVPLLLFLMLLDTFKFLSCRCLCYSRFTRWVGTVIKRMRTYVRLPESAGTQPWSKHELRRIAMNQERTARLDERALVWASSVEEAAEGLDVRRCFEDLQDFAKPRFVLEWVALKAHGREGLRAGAGLREATVRAVAANEAFVEAHLGLVGQAVDIVDNDVYSGVERSTADVERAYSYTDDVPHILMLAWAFVDPAIRDSGRETGDAGAQDVGVGDATQVGAQSPRAEITLEGGGTADAPPTNAQAHQADTGSTGPAQARAVFQASFFAKLAQVCCHQVFNVTDALSWREWGSHLRVPSVLLFLVVNSEQFEWGHLHDVDTRKLVAWALRAATFVNGGWGQYARFFVIGPQELLFSSSAIALRALADRPELARECGDDVSKLLQQLSDFMDAEKEYVKAWIECVRHRDDALNDRPGQPDPRNTFNAPTLSAPTPDTSLGYLRDSETLPFVAPAAVCSISHSLELIASRGPTSDNANANVLRPDTMSALARLRDMCAYVLGDDSGRRAPFGASEGLDDPAGPSGSGSELASPVPWFSYDDPATLELCPLSSSEGRTADPAPRKGRQTSGTVEVGSS